MYRPDGTVYGACSTPPPWAAVSHGRKRTYVAHPPFVMGFNATDAPGSYRVTARVRDTARGTTIDLETEIVLAEAGAGSQPQPD